jgi:hypothetical protein
MKKWLQDNLRSIIVTSFIIPILLVAFVSISHVVTFYGLSNPMSWAIFLSVAVEIAALAALAGVSAKFGKFIYIPFGIVTLIQFIGNFFYSFSFIETSSQEFKTWIEMVSGIFEPMGIEPTDVAAHKRILAFFTGGLLPFISLTFAHMLIVYSERDKEIPKEETIFKDGKKIGELSASLDNNGKEVYIDLINIDKKLQEYVFAYPKTNPTRSVVVWGYGSIYNHSKNNNADWISDEEKNVFTFFTIRDINEGEEICTNYGEGYERVVKTVK